MYGRPEKYDEAYMEKFLIEWANSMLELRTFCRHKKVPYTSIRAAIKRMSVIDKKPTV